MSDFTKLRNLLNKTKPTLQLEIRKKKPTTTKEFLQYAIEIEELFRLSNIDISDTYSKVNPTNQIISAVTSSRSTNPSTKTSKPVSSNTNPEKTLTKDYEDNQYHNNDTSCPTQPVVPSNSYYPQSNRSWHNSNQTFTYPDRNSPPSNHSSRTPYHFNYNQKHSLTHKTTNNRNNNHTPKNTHTNNQRYHNTIANIPSLLDPLTYTPSFENCSRCQQAGHQEPDCPHF